MNSQKQESEIITKAELIQGVFTQEMEEKPVAHRDLCQNCGALIEWTEAGEKNCLVCGAENHWDDLSEEAIPAMETRSLHQNEYALVYIVKEDCWR